MRDARYRRRMVSMYVRMTDWFMVPVISCAAEAPVVIAADPSESTSGAEALKVNSKAAAKVGLSTEEKKRLLEQYGCEFDEEEYPLIFKGPRT